MTPLIVRTHGRTRLWMDKDEADYPFGKNGGYAEWKRELSDDECDSLLANPYQFFKKYER